MKERTRPISNMAALVCWRFAGSIVAAVFAWDCRETQVFAADVAQLFESPVARSAVTISCRLHFWGSDTWSVFQLNRDAHGALIGWGWASCIFLPWRETSLRRQRRPPKNPEHQGPFCWRGRNRRSAI
jgi:hypothetical protein